MFEAEKHILRVLYTYLIPYTWRLGGHHPVLVQTNVGCDDEGLGEFERLYPKDWAGRGVILRRRDGQQEGGVVGGPGRGRGVSAEWSVWEQL